MEHYVGLDVSLKLTAICIVDRTGKIVREGVVTSDPETIAAFIKSHAPDVARIGLETGATATWLWTELKNLGLPVICIDARHAKAALKMQINKSDRNDAVGIARILAISATSKRRLVTMARTPAIQISNTWKSSERIGLRRCRYPIGWRTVQ